MGFRPVPSRLELDEPTRAKLELLARSRGTGGLEVLRDALALYEKASLPSNGNGAHPTSVLEKARRAGLIGSLADAPPDLSTNSSHFEGFGGA